MELSEEQKETRGATEIGDFRKANYFQVLDKPGEDRIAMLSDGIFAIAVTLLVLEIRIPTGVNHEEFIKTLTGEFFLSTVFYAVTFAVLAAYWLNHRQLMGLIQRVDRNFLWLNMLFLAFVAFFPVASGLLKFVRYPEAVIVYTTVLAGCGFSALLLWVYAFNKRRLVASEKRIEHNIHIIERNIHFIGASIIPTFLLLSLLLLYLPYFQTSPSDVFYAWLLLPFINIVLMRILLSIIRRHKAKG